MEIPSKGPVVHGAPRERLVGIPSAFSVRPRNLAGIARIEETEDLILLRDGGGLAGPRFSGVPDENRGVVIPDLVATVRGRGYALGVKGAGARTPLYGPSPLDFAFQSEFSGTAEMRSEEGLTEPRLVTSELWYGESPYGAQGDVPAAYSLQVTELADGCSIHGFHICPVIQVAEFPPEHVADAYGNRWYRRYRGRYLQEQRLVPSNVRLYHASERTLGQNPAAVLADFGATTPEALDAFMDAYIASGIAALTVFVRTMRTSPWGVQGLDYANVWLDKDCLVAPDGTLHFADLEGLEWVVAGQDWSTEERVREQFDHNVYEFLYGLDVLQREWERAAGRSLTQAERRAALVPRFELALANDLFVTPEPSRAGLDLVVRPPLGDRAPVPIRLIDMR